MNLILVLYAASIFALNIRSEIPAGYYYGTGVFVKVNNEMIIADFIFFQKYPRDLLTDTLFFDEESKTWVGDSSVLFEKKDRYYIYVKDKNSLFYTKKPVQIRQDEKYYFKHVNEYRNLALLHKCYEEYMAQSIDKPNANIRFSELKRRYAINQFQEHHIFVVELEKLKKELYESK